MKMSSLHYLIVACLGAGSAFADSEWNHADLVLSEKPLAENLVQALPWRQQDDEASVKLIHRNAYYHLVAFSDDGDVVQLHDASKWTVRPSHREKVLYWVQSDDIYIKPDACCLSPYISSYKYVLYNRSVNETADVNMVSPPLPLGEATFRIVNIEAHARLVQLSDNTIWQIDAKSANSPHWKVGQRVLIGVNNHWRTAPYPHILINADVYQEPFSAASFYGYSGVY